MVDILSNEDVDIDGSYLNLVRNLLSLPDIRLIVVEELIQRILFLYDKDTNIHIYNLLQVMSSVDIPPLPLTQLLEIIPIFTSRDTLPSSASLLESSSSSSSSDTSVVSILSSSSSKPTISSSNPFDKAIVIIGHIHLLIGNSIQLAHKAIDQYSQIVQQDRAFYVVILNSIADIIQSFPLQQFKISTNNQQMQQMRKIITRIAFDSLRCLPQTDLLPAIRVLLLIDMSSKEYSLMYHNLRDIFTENNSNCNNNVNNPPDIMVRLVDAISNLISHSTEASSSKIQDLFDKDSSTTTVLSASTEINEILDAMKIEIFQSNGKTLSLTIFDLLVLVGLCSASKSHLDRSQILLSMKSFCYYSSLDSLSICCISPEIVTKVIKSTSISPSFRSSPGLFLFVKYILLCYCAYEPISISSMVTIIETVLKYHVHVSQDIFSALIELCGIFVVGLDGQEKLFVDPSISEFFTKHDDGHSQIQSIAEFISINTSEIILLLSQSEYIYQKDMTSSLYHQLEEILLNEEPYPLLDPGGFSTVIGKGKIINHRVLKGRYCERVKNNLLLAASTLSSSMRSSEISISLQKRIFFGGSSIKDRAVIVAPSYQHESIANDLSKVTSKTRANEFVQASFDIIQPGPAIVASTNIIYENNKGDIIDEEVENMKRNSIETLFHWAKRTLGAPSVTHSSIDALFIVKALALSSNMQNNQLGKLLNGSIEPRLKDGGYLKKIRSQNGHEHYIVDISEISQDLFTNASDESKLKHSILNWTFVNELWASAVACESASQPHQPSFCSLRDVLLYSKQLPQQQSKKQTRRKKTNESEVVDIDDTIYSLDSVWDVVKDEDNWQKKFNSTDPQSTLLFAWASTAASGILLGTLNSSSSLQINDKLRYLEAYLCLQDRITQCLSYLTNQSEEISTQFIVAMQKYHQNILKPIIISECFTYISGWNPQTEHSLSSVLLLIRILKWLCGYLARELCLDINQRNKYIGLKGVNIQRISKVLSFLMENNIIQSLSSIGDTRITFAQTKIDKSSHSQSMTNKVPRRYLRDLSTYRICIASLCFEVALRGEILSKHVGIEKISTQTSSSSSSSSALKVAARVISVKDVAKVWLHSESDECEELISKFIDAYGPDSSMTSNEDNDNYERDATISSYVLNCFSALLEHLQRFENEVDNKLKIQNDYCRTAFARLKDAYLVRKDDEDIDTFGLPYPNLMLNASKIEELFQLNILYKKSSITTKNQREWLRQRRFLIKVFSGDYPHLRLMIRGSIQSLSQEAQIKLFEAIMLRIEAYCNANNQNFTSSLSKSNVQTSDTYSGMSVSAQKLANIVDGNAINKTNVEFDDHDELLRSLSRETLYCYIECLFFNLQISLLSCPIAPDRATITKNGMVIDNNNIDSSSTSSSDSDDQDSTNKANTISQIKRKTKKPRTQSQKPSATKENDNNFVDEKNDAITDLDMDPKVHENDDHAIRVFRYLLRLNKIVIVLIKSAHKIRIFSDSRTSKSRILITSLLSIAITSMQFCLKQAMERGLRMKPYCKLKRCNWQGYKDGINELVQATRTMIADAESSKMKNLVSKLQAIKIERYCMDILSIIE